MLFDMGVLKSHAFSVPVISVGNITVGGTGKTPHVEHLLKLLLGIGKVAVLSRGYKRSTRGFVLADDTATAQTIGDEPMQLKEKFPNAIVAVDGDRVRGINRLLKTIPDIDVILLDDAFQHRYVKPGINILLVDYHRLIIYDRLLPAGRLREPLNGKNRADMVIVTKCPKELKPMDYRVITRAMDLYPYQTLFFTTFDYSPLRPVFTSHGTNPTLETLSDYHILLLTGIASPRHLKEDLERLSTLNPQQTGTESTPSSQKPETSARPNGMLAEPVGARNLKSQTSNLKPQTSNLKPQTSNLKPQTSNLKPQITTLSFSDHHRFRRKDVQRINSMFEALPQPRCIITTEKDATRLAIADGLADDVKRNIFALPVHVSFMLGQEQTFNDNIIGYVRKNSRNSILVRGKDDHKAQDSDSLRDRPRTISFRNN